MKIGELKKYKKILILGYGKEGQATEKFLRKHLPEVTIGIADKKFSADYLKEQENYDLVIKTPGIPKRLVIKPYSTATNIFFANVKNIVIGVTGTKGKSTTVSLIYSIFKNAGKRIHLLGNIGKPMLEELLGPVDGETIFVVELSSYQLEDIQYSPHISVVLDLFPEHMNYHGDVKYYYLAKKNIVSNVGPNDYFIYNPRFKELKNWAKEVNCKTIPFKEINFDLKNISLIGEHNQENIKAAVTVAHLFKIDDMSIIKTIKMFKPLPHRLQKIGIFKGILFYDDAISTTPESTICAIKSLKEIGTIFLGGEDRGYDFEGLVDVIRDYKIPNVVLFPDSGDKIFEICEAKKIKFRHLLKSNSMEKAVKFAYKYTPQGKICLLSNASPSYSLWNNFEEKGNQFQFFVKKYQ